MEIIPVIDLMRGQVVQARAGHRESYLPLQSPLCSSAEPADVMAAFLRLAPFATVYLADLDAITLGRSQRHLIEGLVAGHPQVEFWVDAGMTRDPHLPWVPVIGSESLDRDSWRVAQDRETPWILSLDRLDGRFLGPSEILQQADRWPERIIHMNLNRVGGDQGPDLAGLAELAARVGGSRVVAAGGIRGPQDLQSLEAMGVGRALVASALHAGVLLSLPEQGTEIRR
ncbi:MAG: nickel transporter [Methylococcaceae bacterium]|nr:nickel transporter [Methylococcaceae bacterium]